MARQARRPCTADQPWRLRRTEGGVTAYSWREKICRKNRKTFRMSRKIDAASNGAERMSGAP